MTTMRRCSNCFSEIQKGQLTCPVCGGKKFVTSVNPKGDETLPGEDTVLTSSEASPFCPQCGSKQESANKFCGQCGSHSTPTAKVTSNSVLGKFSALSTKGKFFHSSWIFINFIFIIRFFSESSKPVDRLRSLCGLDGVNCAPSSEELAAESISNLIVWNILFLIFLFVYKKVKSKRSK